MNQATLMRMPHCFADLRHHRQPLAGVQLMRVGVLPQRLATDELHGKVRLRSEASIRCTGFIDLCDAWVLQPAERLRFLFKAPQKFGINTITGDIARKLGHIRTLARDREMRAGMGEQRLNFSLQLRIFGADCGKKRRPFARFLSESSVIQRVNHCPALSFHHILPGPSTGELRGFSSRRVESLYFRH